MKVVPFRWKKGRLDVLDQRLLPAKVRFIPCRSPLDVEKVIREMAVRGAPAIGCVAAYGMVLAAVRKTHLKKAAALLKAARPTAVNLAWAVDRMLLKAATFGNSKYQVPNTKQLTDKGLNVSSLRVAWNLGFGICDFLLKEARLIEKEDLENNRAMGRYGAALLKKKSVVLTHCNAGALATAGFGTALGIIREGFNRGKIKKVLVDETRPYLQGARLTAWELALEKIPHELITDNMAGHLMKTEKVKAVIVGCDRVAANGDAANKIGTYALAVLAKYHRIPFYVAMPQSTLDLKIKSGRQIPIEERSSDEVTSIRGARIAPLKTKARHPGFDVTPAKLITAIVTEHGVVTPPYQKKLEGLLNGKFQIPRPKYQARFNSKKTKRKTL